MASLMPGQRLLVRKRSRLAEDDGQELCTSSLTGFSEHRNKRANCQPAVPAPISNVDSTFGFSVQSPIQSSCEPLYSNVEQFYHQTTQGNHFSHMPTPTDSSFSSIVDSGAWSGPGPAINVNEGYSSAMQDSMDGDFVPRSIEPHMEWSEAPNCPVNDSGLPSPDMGNGRIRHMSASAISETYDMDYDQSPERELLPRMMVPTLPEASSPTREIRSSPSWKGHHRSKHTLNSWTSQIGMKRTFSVDFHPDCQKCRDKVPGHFNHIVIGSDVPPPAHQ